MKFPFSFASLSMGVWTGDKSSIVIGGWVDNVKEVGCLCKRKIEKSGEQGP